jgi:uncharacterized protein (DUF2141 family)
MLLLLFYSLYLQVNTPVALEIKIEGLIPGKGTIRVGLYDSAAAWRDEDHPTHAQVVPLGNENFQIIRFQGLRGGTYVVAAYQDVNGNQKIDKNIIGIPTEAYAFSNNVFPKWKSPAFHEAAIRLEKPTESIKLKFRTWGN